MKRLSELYETAVNCCEECGIPISDRIESVSVNNKNVKRWGRCTYNRRTETFKIEISYMLMNDDVSDDSAISTLIHELLHTCKNCQDHGSLWKYYASVINNTYGYNVKRANSFAEHGLDDSIAYHYVVKCHKCGQEYKWMRASKKYKLVKIYGRNSGCACGVCGSKELYVEK